MRDTQHITTNEKNKKNKKNDRNIPVLHFMWLFDSIVHGKLEDMRKYEMMVKFAFFCFCVSVLYFIQCHGKRQKKTQTKNKRKNQK